jgi:type I restriction enzyme R subunit
MVTKYIVFNETRKVLMALRPYQYYATEAIIDRVKNSDKNGYIWHTKVAGGAGALPHHGAKAAA